MMDQHALSRHYRGLSDEARREALGDGAEGYTPAAWGVMTREAAARGLSLPPVIPREPPAPPLGGRVFAGVVLAAMFVLTLNLLREWHWFGSADKGVLVACSLGGFYIMMRWFGEEWLERVRQHEEEKRMGGPLE